MGVLPGSASHGIHVTGMRSLGEDGVPRRKIIAAFSAPFGRAWQPSACLETFATIQVNRDVRRNRGEMSCGRSKLSYPLGLFVSLKSLLGVFVKLWGLVVGWSGKRCENCPKSKSRFGHGKSPLGSQHVTRRPRPQKIPHLCHTFNGGRPVPEYLKSRATESSTQQ
jgi:hypothetical protein